jgi:homoserine O-acetyltransferase
MGWRARAEVLQVLATRTPEALLAMFPHPLDVLPWIKAQEDAVFKTGFDANDWVAQTWAYDNHNIGDTRNFGRDHLRALTSIKAKTLIITGGNLDLYNPVEEAEAGRYIPDSRVLAIPLCSGTHCR